MSLLMQHAQSSKTPPLYTTAPPPPTAAQYIPPITNPPLITSGLVFDEYGFPITTSGPIPSVRDEHSSFSGLPRFRPPPVTAGPYVEHTSMGMFSMPPPGFGPSGERVWTPGADYGLRKLKMPLLDGEDAYGWVFRIERFFDIQGMGTTGEKLRAAVICLEGEALAWFRWTDKRLPFRSWEQLKAGLLDRFQPSHDGDLYEQFLNIKQEGTVRAYVSRFESLAAQLEGVSERVLEGTFLKGLRASLRNSVRVLQPTSLGQAMKLAIMMDESGSSSSGDQLHSSPKPALSRAMSGPTQRSAPTGTAGDFRTRTGDNRQPFRRMTAAEMNDKRAKGLCFRCDGKFGTGHRCPGKTLHVMLIHDDEGSDEDEPEGAEHAHLDVIEVSAHSVVGLTTPHTMKLRGSIREHSVVVLIDSGATHNFVSLHLVEHLGLVVSGNRGTGVILGNGKTERSYGICKNVELVLPGLRVVEHFFPLELGSTDVILGMQWLRKLGNIQVNWKELTMSFQVGDALVDLQGEPGLTRSEASLQAIVRALPDVSAGYVVVPASLAATSLSESQVNPALDDLLDQYADVFSMPTGLPPSRGHEHRIILKGGTEPISVRPYRYPQLQKNEIER